MKFMKTVPSLDLTKDEVVLKEPFLGESGGIKKVLVRQCYRRFFSEYIYVVLKKRQELDLSRYVHVWYFLDWVAAFFCLFMI